MHGGGVSGSGDGHGSGGGGGDVSYTVCLCCVDVLRFAVLLCCTSPYCVCVLLDDVLLIPCYTVMCRVVL